MDVAVEGGGEQVAEALHLDESCCDVDPERLSPKCLHEPDDPDPGPLKEELQSQEHHSNSEVHMTEHPTHPSQALTEDDPHDEVSEYVVDPSSEENTSTLSCPEAEKVEIPEQELYNSFHYWRMPIPQIDLDLELLEQKCNNSEIFSNSPSSQVSTPALGRKQLEELIENLEPHIDDPDVKGE